MDRNTARGRIRLDLSLRPLALRAHDAWRHGDDRAGRIVRRQLDPSIFPDALRIDPDEVIRGIDGEVIDKIELSPYGMPVVVVKVKQTTQDGEVILSATAEVELPF